MKEKFTSQTGSPSPYFGKMPLANAIAGAAPESTIDAPDAIDDSSPPNDVKSTDASSGQVLPIPLAKLPPSLRSKLRVALSQKGTIYGVVPTGGNLLAHPIGSKQFNHILLSLAYEAGLNFRDIDLKEINDTLIAFAMIRGEMEPVWCRVAPDEGGIEIDVGDEKNTRILVTAGRVESVNQDSKTLFCRTPVSTSLVMPAEEGNLDLLKPYLNLHAIDQMLLIAWMSYTLAHAKTSTSKYPILVINGDQGSGKTSLCNNVIYPLTDPNVIGVQVFPGSVKDLAIASQNAHVLCYDNMRSFKASMSDMLCIAATGGAISNRALYTDADQHVLFLHVALVLNGIHSFINQPDLAQRCVPIRTLTLPEAKRKSEAAMLKALKADMPAIFRGLLDLIAQVFLHLPEAEVTYPERMLDFVTWLAAMEKVHTAPVGTYQQAYSNSLRQAQLDSLMENILAATVVEFCDGIRDDNWHGTPAELLTEMNSKVSTGTTYSRDWPQNSIALSKRLNGLKASLLTQGIDIQFGRGKERTITIRKIEGGVHG